MRKGLFNKNEIDYYTLFERASDPIAVVDFTGKILDVNESMCNLLGYTYDELLEMRVEDLIDPEELQHNPVPYETIIEKKQLVRERRMKKKDGSIIEMEINSNKVAENKIISIGRDISELKKVQKQIILSESTFRTAFDFSGIGMALVAPDGKWMRVNKKLCEIVGYSEPELLALTFQDITHPDDLEKDISLVTKALKGDVSNYTLEKRYLHKNGSVIWISLIVALVRDNDGQPLFFVSQIKDITDRKNAETELNKINRDIIERVKELQCMYKISELSNDPHESIKSILQKTVDFLPLSYQYPDVTCARIIFEGQVSESGKFALSEWKQEAVIKTKEKEVGLLEVYYTKDMPDEQEGPFLSEERFLINSVAGILGGAIERRQAEAELRESEDKFRSLVEQHLWGIYIIQDDKLVYVNPWFEKTFKYAREQMLNHDSFEPFIHEDDLDQVKKNYFSRLSGDNLPGQFIFRGIRSDGEVLYLEVVASAISYNSKPAVIGALIDITDRMEEEKRINEAVTEAQENERLQIGMELHDNVKQILAASKLYIDMTLGGIDDKEKTIETLLRLKKFINEAIDELRRLSHKLAPSVDPTLTLFDKVNSLVKTVDTAGSLPVSLNIKEPAHPFSNNIQLAFYRILQEQLSNILKYAKASNVGISIDYNDKEIYMRIKDDGVGFDTNIRKGGIGLENIRRRTLALDGKVEILSSPGKGCEIFVQVPNPEAG